MATTAITEDFVTKSGLNVQGTSTVTSSTGQSGTLQVNGGAAIAKNLIVGSAATVGGSLFVNDNATIGIDASVGKILSVGTTATIGGNLFVYGHTRIVGMTATGAVSILDSTLATTGTNGALVVTGGGNFGKNLVVLSTVSSTGTTFNNSLYVAGGVGIDKNLVVSGTSVFNGDAIFNGSTTYVYSANTVYTDNILELHTPSTGTPGVWSVDDGKDIGLRFHYYSGSNKNAALVLANDTKYLEWYVAGAEGTDTFAGGTYGTFKTGEIQLTSNNNATNTQSGALQVVGGVGIGGDLRIGGTIFGVVTTATNIEGGATGSLPYQSSTGTTAFIPIGNSGNILYSNGTIPYWSSIGDITPDYANTATNLKFGAAMQIPFQTDTGKTEFEYNLRYDYNADTLRTVNAVFTGTTNSSNTVSGALQVVGGVGIGGNLYVGHDTSIGGDTTLTGNLAVNGGSITTNQSTVNLFTTTAATVNFATAASAITIGSSTGYTTIGTRTTITNTTAATNSVTGALVVAGGVGIGGNIYIGGQTTVNGSIIPDSNSVSIGSLEKPFTDLFLKNSNALYIGNVVLSSTGSQLEVTSIVGPASLSIPTVYVTSATISTSTNTGALVVTGGVGIGGALYVESNVDINSATSSTSVTSGALVVTGGVGIGGALYVESNVDINSIVSSISTTSGALVVAGGVGIGGAVYINDPSYINNSKIITEETIGQYNVTSIIAGTDTAISTSTGNVTIWNTSTLQSVTNRGNTTNNSILITNATDSTSTNSGALQITGGVGIGGNAYIGGNSYIGGNAGIASNLNVGGIATVTSNLIVGGDIQTTASTFNLANTTSTTINFAGSATSVNIGATSGATTVRNDLHVTGNLIVQGTSTVVDSTVTNISDPILTLGSGPNNTDLTLNDNKDRGIAFKYFDGHAKTGFFGYKNSTGYLTFFTSATINNEIVLPNGGTTKGAIDINLAGGTANSLVYQSSSSSTEFLAPDTSGYLLQTNGNSLPPSWISPSSIVSNTATNLKNGTAGQVPYQTAPGVTSFYGPGTAGNVLVSNGTDAPTYNNTLTLTSTLASTSTNSGALQVVGGVGIGSNLYVGGTIFGNLTGVATTATNIQNGVAGQLVYQTALGVTGFVNTASVGTVLVSNGSNSPAYQNTLTLAGTATSISTNTGALQVVGGVGIGADLYVGGTIFGFVGTATNLRLGNTGSIAIQSAAGTTAFIPLGNYEDVLTASTGTATWKSLSLLSVGKANNI